MFVYQYVMHIVNNLLFVTIYCKILSGIGSLHQRATKTPETHFFNTITKEKSCKLGNYSCKRQRNKKGSNNSTESKCENTRFTKIKNSTTLRVRKLSPTLLLTKPSLPYLSCSDEKEIFKPGVAVPIVKASFAYLIGTCKRLW